MEAMSDMTTTEDNFKPVPFEIPAPLLRGFFGASLIARLQED